MATAKAKSNKKNAAKKPITYYYNPYYKNETQLQFLEVWQVLEDDVLGPLYPWQYVATAETSNRIISLNFLALKNFEKDYRTYFDQVFIYKVSAKLLSEGNVHRLGSILQPNLILCFDVYQLEKFGDKDALTGLKFLINIGATIMLSGVDKAPVDVLVKYPASYFLLDYRYYTKNNGGLVSMMSQITKANGITMIVGNVIDKDNLTIFTDNDIEIFSGSALARPKKKVDSFVEAPIVENGPEEVDKKYIVRAENAPIIEDKPVPEVETVTIEVTSQKDELRARLAEAALAKKKAKEEELARKAAEEEAERQIAEQMALEQKRKEEEEALRLAKQLGAGQITTSVSEFASLSKKKEEKKEVKRGSNVIKLTIARPTKSTKKPKSE